MSTARTLWITFCLAWLGFWLIFGWFLPGLNIILAILSGLAILIPIGKPTVKPHTSVTIPSSKYDPRFTEEEKARLFRER